MAKRPRKSTLVSPEQQASPPAEHGGAIITLPEPSNTPESSEAEGQALSTISTRAAFLLLIGALSRDVQRFASWCKPLAIKTAQEVLAWFNDAKASLAQRTRYSKGESAHPHASVSDVQAEGEPRPVPPRDMLAPWLRRNVVVALATATALIIVGTAALMFWALHDVPFNEIASGHVPNQVIALAAADGQPLIQRGPYQEVAATRDQFPDHLVNAVLATEDRRFYDHWGVDVWGITRALSRNLFAGEVREGGSTITQQLLKVLYLEPDRTMRRKVQELFLSLWLEGRLSKDEILTLYLNNVYLGAGATGMPAAARLYFDKQVSELSIPESAMLAGLIAAPSALNPLVNLQEARSRASVVLSAMQTAGFLDESTMQAAQLNSAQLRPRRPTMATGTWFADWAMQEAQDISGQFIGSVKVTTTLVPSLQTIAEQSVQAVMAEQGASGGGSQAAMVVLAPDGAVLAMVGGLDYGDSQFNRALAQRQPGSTFKLFTYYAALKLGAVPQTPIDDRPIDVDGWKPENIDGRYSGRVSLAEAFARSLNPASVRLGMEVGLPNIVAAARELGIEAPLQETPSLILGASEVTLLDLTGAYASIRSGVAPVEPYGIKTFEAPNGRPFSIGPRAQANQPLGEVHEQMLAMLQLVVEQGTGQAAQLDRLAGGKTGTSQDYRDAWFIGFDQSYTVGVWVGNDDSTPMDKVTGGQLPAMIWQKFMLAAGPQVSLEPFVPTTEGAPEQVSAPPQCNIQACSRAYRSFRSSDCTFQPYRGPRRICEK